MIGISDSKDEDDDGPTKTTEEWKVPFERRGGVERGVEFLGFGDREREIELTGPPDEGVVDGP